MFFIQQDFFILIYISVWRGKKLGVVKSVQVDGLDDFLNKYWGDLKSFGSELNMSFDLRDKNKHLLDTRWLGVSKYILIWEKVSNETIPSTIKLVCSWATLVYWVLSTVFDDRLIPIVASMQLLDVYI